MEKLIGPFKQILTLAGMPLKGSLNDDSLQIIPDGGVGVEDGIIVAVGNFEKLRREYPTTDIWEIEEDYVLLPGFIDCHTHMCFAGNRAKDYAMRIAGKSYLEIAQSGGGIWDSVMQTRQASETELFELLKERAESHLYRGVTTMEVKSGYGLDAQAELKLLKTISNVAARTGINMISTCLAAHTLPKDFNGTHREYLDHILHDLLPTVKATGLSNRVDIFIEQSAFSQELAVPYLAKAKKMGFDITVHADQFTTGGSEAAVSVGALSADHLEASGEKEIQRIAASDTVAVALPGASLGLGIGFTPARKLLSAGACLAIASDWNPGSAPMGDLLMQASILSTYEKLTTAETLAGLTYRAAKALDLYDRGTLAPGKRAHMQGYPCSDYREILYHQGMLKPSFHAVFEKSTKGN